MSRYQPAWFVALPRLLYNHNPFYLISALFVLYGLHRSTTAVANWQGDALTIGSLFGYTLLLALSAFAVVRLGKVWDDARTIMLIVVLLFLAISVRFDAIALGNLRHGAALLAAGFAFAAVVTEGLLISLRIRLPAMYRLPYYALLALLFAYPLALANLSVAGHHEQMTWGVFLFPIIASLLLLTLLPAARWGGPPGQPSGTPWSWPLYPWSLFFVILIGLGLRSYWLSVSFQVGKVSEITFRPYFLIPLGFATAILLFELATAAGNKLMRQVAAWAPLGFLLLAFPGKDGSPIAGKFLDDLCLHVGSPALLTIVGLVLYFSLLWWRGVASAQWALMLSLAIAPWISRHTIDVKTLAEPQMLPIAAIAAIQFALAFRRSELWRVPLGLAAALFVAWHEAWQFWPNQLATYCLIHTPIVVLLLAPALVNDDLARRLRWLAAAMIPLTAIVALLSYDAIFKQIPRSLDGGYLATLGAMSLWYWYRSATVAALVEAIATLATLGVLQLRQLTALLANTVLAKGGTWLTWGLVFFIAALVISSMKGGATRTVHGFLSRLNDRLRAPKPSQ
jgi:hypothetical protein